jgi:hypothetical protein
MTGYVRTDTTNNIADGNIISATDLDNEFDGVQAAFNSSTGHNHDGTTGEGAPILVLGPTQDVVVGAAAVTPKTTNTVDIGSGSLKFKDLFLAGNANFAGTTTLGGALTYGGVTLSNAVTGTGNMVLSTSPTLVTPVLGTPTSVTLTNATGLPVATGISGLGSGVATFLATPSSANLAAAVTDETGTGALVFANSPTFVTPALGTPASGVVTNLTGTASININGTVGATTASTGAFTTLTTSSTVTHNGGTANGVAYLNGSKVLTTGSALTYTGTGLGIGADAVFGGGTSTFGAMVSNASGTAGFRLQNTASFAGEIRVDSGGFTIETRPNQPLIFGVNSTEAMRLTSTSLYTASGINVGFGTSSPSAKLSVRTSGTYGVVVNTDNLSLGTTRLSLGGYLDAAGGTGGTAAIGAIHNHNATSESSLAFYTYGGGALNQVAVMNASGNLGLGVTPSASWNSGYKAIQIANASYGSLSGQVGGASTMQLTWGAYATGADSWAYLSTGDAVGQYIMNGGQHRWRTAPSGTAGDAISFTQAMTLDASGNLGVGTTSPAFRQDTKSAVTGTYNSTTQQVVARFYNLPSSLGSGVNSAFLSLQTSPDGGDSNPVARIGVVGESYASNDSAFVVATRNSSGITERARIDSSGNLLVGTTSTSGVYRTQFVCADQYAFLGYNTNSAKAVGDIWNAATTGDNKFFNFITETGGTTRGSITYNRAGGLVAYNVTSDYRAKDISGPVTGSGALIDSVPVYMGKMKGATQERPMFIAHEVPAYAHTGVKDAVDADGKPVYQQMDASALIPVMWAEIQSLRARLAAANI